MFGSTGHAGCHGPLSGHLGEMGPEMKPVCFWCLARLPVALFMNTLVFLLLPMLAAIAAIAAGAAVASRQR